MTTIEAPSGKLPFCTTHLNWKFHHGFAREKQVQTIAEAIGQRFPVHGDSLPPVLTGDLNARPEATEIRFLSGLHAIDGNSVYLADCFAEVGEGPGYTFDARSNPFASFTHEAPRRIDYVFVRGPDAKGRGKPLHCRVVMDEIVDGVAASDHAAVYAEIRM
jgi:endonuclease/exonuclease/phosphatase family metal-dependent hydrolase